MFKLLVYIISSIGSVFALVGVGYLAVAVIPLAMLLAAILAIPLQILYLLNGSLFTKRETPLLETFSAKLKKRKLRSKKSEWKPAYEQLHNHERLAEVVPIGICATVRSENGLYRLVTNSKYRGDIANVATKGGFYRDKRFQRGDPRKERLVSIN